METDDCVEIIVLNKNSKENRTMNENNKTNVKYIELNLQNTKVPIPRQFKNNSSRNDNTINNKNQQFVKFTKLQDNKNIFSKLSSNTVLIKHDNKINSPKIEQPKKLAPKEEIKINYDNRNKSTQQNEKYVQKNVKNKTIVEVRRNPTRLSKKNLDKDFVTSRQKLISTKRKENFPNSESNKRIKLSNNNAYMNTRSVTKKLDTIGSTSQTPSIYDLIDWKEWPVHGMHERPVFHSELGLGTQYSDNRFIKNLDTITDTNASDESEAESEDHDEDFLRLKKLIRQRIKDLESHKIENSSDNNIDIFQLTMHKNLHLVLAFCTQISSHEYQTQIQNKLKLLKAKITADSQDWSKNETNESKNENIDKPILINNSVPAGNIPTNSKTKNISNNTYKVLKFISARMEPAKCLITPRKTVANIQNNQITNIQNNCSKLQDIIRGSSKNALILLKIQEPPKVNSKRIENSCQNNQCAKPLVTNLNWNDSTINNDSMMNITSFYENFLPVEEVNYLQESDEKTVLEIKDNDQNKINEINQNINETPETMTINYCDSIKGIDSQNCDSIGKQNNYNFTDQRKFGLIGDFYHKSTAIVDEQKIKESDENQEILEALDLSTVRTRKEVSKSKKEEETLKSRKENIKSKKEVIKGGKSREEIKTKKETKLKQDSIKTKEEILKAKKENLKSSEEILKINETLDGKKEEILNKEDLQTLLESTIILYCIITGADQENVANYIDTLNAVENLEWLKEDSTASK